MKSKFFWILIGIGVLLVFLLILVSNVIEVGERLRNIHQYAEYGFYAVSIVLIYFLIINPIRIIVFSPSFSVQTVLDNDGKKNNRTNKKVAKRILKQNILDQIDADKLRLSMSKSETLKAELNRVFSDSMKKEFNKIIIKNAKTAMLSTAISQNSKLDMISMFAINLKMIKELVQRCGFRPSMTKLGKLSVNVFLTALIAEGLEDVNVEEMLPSSTLNNIAEIPFIKPVLSSVAQGVSNALMTIRIGVVTRKYLFADAGATSKTQIRVQAIKESIKMLPIVVKDSVASFPSKLSKVFTHKKETNE